MANLKVSERPDVTGNGASTDMLGVSDGTTISKKTTLQKIANFVTSYLPTVPNIFTATQTMSGAQHRLAMGADIASAATVGLSTATGNSVTVTGTTTITAFGTVQAGAIFVLTFAASLTITHNATTLICPNNQNIVTQAGDQVVVESLGSGNWRVLLVKPQLVSAFTAYQSTLQSLLAATSTRALFQTEEFDNLSEYDNTTSRFTAKQAGIYIFCANVTFAAGTDGELHIIDLYKNGAHIRRGDANPIGAAASVSIGAGFPVKLAAGDIIDIFIYSSNARDTVIGSIQTYFSGVRLV